MGGPDDTASGGTIDHFIRPSIRKQASLSLHISHMDDLMTYGELKILAYVWVQVHDVYILNCLIFPRLIMKTHSPRTMHHGYTADSVLR